MKDNVRHVQTAEYPDTSVVYFCACMLLYSFLSINSLDYITVVAPEIKTHWGDAHP